MSDKIEIPCWIYGYSDSTVFSVKIAKSLSVMHLRDSIFEKNKIGLRDYYDPSSLTLYQVSPILSADFDAKLGHVWSPLEVDGVKKLPPLDPLAAHFSSPELGAIHVIVQLPSRDKSSPDVGDKRPRSVGHEESRSKKRRRVLDDAQQAIVFGREALSPSSAAKVRSMESQQTKYPIYNGRPADLCGPPVAIYHHVFAEFSDAITNGNLSPPAEVYQQTHEFLEAAACFYKNEDERIKALNSSLSSLIGWSNKTTLSCGSALDRAILLHSNHEPPLLLADEEWKNELGIGQAEQGFQAGQGYRRFWVQQETTEFVNASCCPSFIISFAGPYMCISGGVMVDQVIVQPLTEYICLAGDPDVEARIRYVARIFHALAAGLDNLRRFYRSLVPTTSPVLSRLFPCSVSCVREDGNTVEFDYVCRVQPDSKHGAPFEAETKDGKRLVVKFCRTYHADAHRLLAASGLAPPIDYAGPHAAGITMVVMDYIRGTHVVTGPLSEHALKDVSNAVEKLHRENLVFGDLRRPNILVPDREGSGLADSNGTWAMLLDFDWCDLDGEGTYPVSLNDSDDMLWHKDVKRGGIMRKEHDLHLLHGLGS